MTPALWIAAALAVALVFIVWVVRRIRAAAEREAREDAAWDALGALIREGRASRARRARRGAVTFDMTTAEAHHALTVHALRRQALGARQDEWAA